MERDNTNWKTKIVIYLIMGGMLLAGVYLVVLWGNRTKLRTNYAGPTRTTFTASDLENIRKQTQLFYNEWLNDMDRDQSLNVRVKSLVDRELLTQKAADSIMENQTFDLPTCSQNPLPVGRYQFSTPVIQENTAKMTVMGIYDSPPATRINLNLLKFNNVWSIDGFECTTPPTDAR